MVITTSSASNAMLLSGLVRRLSLSKPNNGVIGPGLLRSACPFLRSRNPDPAPHAATRPQAEQSTDGRKGAICSDREWAWVRERASERARQRSHPSPRLASIDQIHCNKINHGSERNATPVAKHSRSRQNDSRLADGHGTNTLVSECLTRRPSEDLMRSLPRSHGTGEKDFPSQGPGRARAGAAYPPPPPARP